MTRSKIYKILYFEKTKLIITKLLRSQKNLIIVIGNVKHCGAQIHMEFMQLNYNYVHE
jgi:hypothetical protein